MNRSEIGKQFLQSQEKYVYYIIALSVSSVGFAIFKTSESKLTYQLIPLGIALLCWALSVFFGLRFLMYYISRLRNTHELLLVDEGKHEKIGSNIEAIHIATTQYRISLQKDEKNQILIFRVMNFCFYIGIISFITWHVLHLYNNTVSIPK